MNSDASAPARPLLRRSADDRILLGICAGIARSFELRPLVVRSVAVLAAALAFPLLVIAYAAVALIVPRDDGRVLLGGRPDDDREQLLGWSFVLLAGLLLVVSRLQPEELVWPALDQSVLPFAGIAIVWLTIRDRKDAAPDVPGASAPGAPPAPAPPSPSAVSEEDTIDSTATTIRNLPAIPSRGD